MPTVALIGTLDTKGAEYAFVRDRLHAAGVDVVVVDAGVQRQPAFDPDVRREEVAQAGGSDVAVLAERADRGAAIKTMADGATVIVRRLHDEGRCDGALALFAERVSASTGSSTVFLPLRGVSAIAGADGPFYDAEADVALFGAIRTSLADGVELVEAKADINDPAFALAMANKLHEHIQKRTAHAQVHT